MARVAGRGLDQRFVGGDHLLGAPNPLEDGDETQARGDVRGALLDGLAEVHERVPVVPDLLVEAGEGDAHLVPAAVHVRQQLVDQLRERVAAPVHADQAVEERRASPVPGRGLFEGLTPGRLGGLELAELLLGLGDLAPDDHQVLELPADALPHVDPRRESRWMLPGAAQRRGVLHPQEDVARLRGDQRGEVGLGARDQLGAQRGLGGHLEGVLFARAVSGEGQREIVGGQSVQPTLAPDVQLGDRQMGARGLGAQLGGVSVGGQCFGVAIGGAVEVAQHDPRADVPGLGLDVGAVEVGEPSKAADAVGHLEEPAQRVVLVRVLGEHAAVGLEEPAVTGAVIGASRPGRQDHRGDDQRDGCDLCSAVGDGVFSSMGTG